MKKIFTIPDWSILLQSAQNRLINNLSLTYITKNSLKLIINFNKNCSNSNGDPKH